jgi:hypothetical protein
LERAPRLLNCQASLGLLNLGEALSRPDQANAALVLARACLAGPIDLLAIRSNCTRVFNAGGPWLVKLTAELMNGSRHLLDARDVERLTDVITTNAWFLAACDSFDPPRPVGYFVVAAQMQDAPAMLKVGQLPPLSTPGDLAAWLEISVADLDWLADIGSWRQQERSALCHYRYRWIDKRRGGTRLLEIPKSRLLKIQRRILRGILEQVPVHSAAHGCVSSRSIVTNANAHAGRQGLLRVDLKSFFGSVHVARIHNIFRTLGYPTSAARYLAALTTTATPRWVLRAAQHDLSPDAMKANAERNDDLKRRHLPQGAPTSPMLANLAAWRLDLRMDRAADASQMRYTRYVDDLFFSASSMTPARAQRFANMVYSIVLEEGFTPNYRKTRYMPRSRRQRAAGVIVNVRPNISRVAYDRLKATLTNCVRRGAEQENRLGHRDFRGHLLGRVAFVEQVNPARGRKLRSIFERIDWKGPARSSSAD